MQSKKHKRIPWQLIGLVGVIVLVLVLALVFVDITAVFQELRQANPSYLLGSSLFLLAGLVFYAARWRFLLQNKPSLGHTFHACNIGHAGNILVPGRVGEPIRILVMGREETVSYTESVSSFVVERLFEQMMRLLALATAVAAGSGLQVTPGSVAAALLFLAVMFTLLFLLVKYRESTLRRGTAVLAKLPRVSAQQAENWLLDLLDNMQYVASMRNSARAIGLSLLSWGFFWLFFYVALLALGDRIPAQERLPISLGALALSPPSAATQPGLFHGSVVIPLTAVGFNEVILVAYAIILHIIEMFWIILLAIWGLLVTGVSLSSIVTRQGSEQ